MCSAVVSAFIVSARGQHQVKTADCRRLGSPADYSTSLPKADGWTVEELGGSPGSEQAGVRGTWKNLVSHQGRHRLTVHLSSFASSCLLVHWLCLICRVRYTEVSSLASYCHSLLVTRDKSRDKSEPAWASMLV